MSGLPWTDREDALLAQYYPDGGSVACEPFLPGRNRNSIGARAFILNISHAKTMIRIGRKVKQKSDGPLHRSTNIPPLERELDAPIIEPVAPQMIYSSDPLKNAIQRRKSIDEQIEKLLQARAKLYREIALIRSQTAKHTGVASRVA